MSTSNGRADEYAFALHRAELQSRTIVQNLVELAAMDVRAAVPASAPTERRGTAIVVGAGPSLSGHLDAVRHLSSTATIYAVNAALPALRSAGIPVDWLIVRESLDQSRHLHGGGFANVALDIAAHAETWKVAKREKARIHLFAPATQTWSIPVGLGMRPLYGGTAALTGACALAAEHGAETVAIFGVDLAVIDGAAYDRGSAYGEVRGEIEGGALKMRDTAAWRSSAIAAGVEPEPELRVLDMVECWDGERRPALHREQLDWLGVFARRGHRDGFECYDAGERGAKKEGWQNAKAWARESGHEDVECSLPWIDCDRVANLLARIRGDAQWYLDVDPRRAMEMEPRESTLLIETMSAGDLIRIRNGAVPSDRMAATYAAFARHAGWVMRALPA